MARDDMHVPVYIILRYLCDDNIDMTELKDILENRVRRSAREVCDILIVKSGKLQSALRLWG